ncbi:zinc finger protein 691-like [Sebastes umbrosus]|uniref:zinc finger protein 691-like n=1 Tax=Sebastes umbrosus TaxID=72105 RepID=UPI00189FDDEC|nr:zinc finger protein 691-like [Sebastes umbrosus]
MLKLDGLRLFVDRRLSAVTDDIFLRLASTVTEYEREVYRLKQEIHRQRRLLEDRPEDRPGDTPGDTPEDTPGDRPEGVLQVSSTEEEQQVRGRSFVKQEEGGASVTEETDTRFIQSPDWLRETPETEQSPSSNQIQSCREEVGPQPAVNKQEVFSVKQEVDEGHMMLEEVSSQQEGVLPVFTIEEEQQVRGRGFTQLIREGGASGPEETYTMSTQSPDWLMESNDDEGSPSSHREENLLPGPSDYLIRPEPGGTCTPPHHNMYTVIQSESSTEDSDDAQSESGLQGTPGTGTRTPADQKLLVCGSCDREFSSTRTLRKHIRRNMSQDQDQMSCSLRRQRAPFQTPAKSFSCRVCGSSFYTQGILVRHAENHCKEPESQCGACGDHLGSTETLRDHLRSHKELGSTCDVCGKKCSSIRRMEIHKRVHTGEKPYRCGFCNRDFSRKESLERHLKVHSGDRPHNCGLCRRTFTRREYLVHHLNTGHTERLGPPAGTERTEPFTWSTT